MALSTRHCYAKSLLVRSLVGLLILLLVDGMGYTKSAPDGTSRRMFETYRSTSEPLLLRLQ